MLADAELQKAVYQRIRDDAQMALIMGSPVRVFDYVPENTAFPYIQYTLGQSAEWDTTTENGFDTTYVLHVWSDQDGTKECHTIMQRLYLLLHEKYDFTLELYRMINQRFEWSEVLRDPEGQAYHGMMRFRVKMDSLETEAP